MASARARMGKAMRSMTKRQKTTGVVTGALGVLGTVAAFGAGQVKKADTAWGEYEAGHKALGGEGFERPKFGQKGFFKGPEGDVRIGASIYDRSKIQEAGSFLSSDAAAVLDDDARKQYLGRTSPGREMTNKDMPEFGTSQEINQLITQPTTQPTDTVTTQPSTLPTIPKFSTQDYKQTVTGTPYTPSRQHAMPGPNVNIDFKSQIKQGFKNIVSSIGQGLEEGAQYNKEIPWDQQGVPWEKNKDISSEGTDGKPFPNWPQLPSFAKGGDFITNGPQEILVGDNPGGRERVTIKPLSSKKDAEFGRYGDDDMKMIDGELAHIDSSIEGDMSPEDIKKYGSGTINPITGKKEYFVGAVSAGLAIGTSLYKGYQAMQNRGDADAAREAAGDIQQEQLDFLGDVRGQTVTSAKETYALGQQESGLGAQISRSQFATGQSNIGMGANMELRRTQAFGDQSYSQSGLVTSGTIEQKVGMQTDDINAKYKSDMTKLFETKELEAQQRNLQMVGAQKQLLDTKAKADLAYRSGAMSAEEAYENTLTGLESIPGGSEGYQHPLGRFLEGALG
tara:strand:- start:108 stop:1799 length:1692 start_codon:yes stop_codon:yes gene_type:complete